MMLNNPDQLNLMLAMFVPQLPILLVCLVGGGVVLAKWEEAPSAAVWALLGFGLSAVLCIAIPVLQTLVQRWLVESHHTVPSRTWLLTGFSFFWSVLRAGSYGLLLVAIYAGRASRPPSATVASSPPPLG